MHEDLVEFLDRQRAHMLGLGASRLLVELHRFLEALRSDTRLRNLLDDVAHEGADLLARYLDHDRAMCTKFEILLATVPDDPFGPAVTNNLGQARRLLAQARTAEDGVDHHEKPSDPSVSTPVVDLLLTRSSPTPNHDDIDLATGIDELGAEHERARREYLLRARIHPGHSLRRLDRLVRQINPRLDFSLEGVQEMYGTIYYAQAQTLRDIAYGDKVTQGTEIDLVSDFAVPAIKDDISRVCDELRQRVGTTRSRRALIDRYKQRCEWYARDEMRELATVDDGKPEDRLVDDLARFLFDQGVNPLSRPMTGRLAPDLLADFYVEAKQYPDRAGALAAVRKGTRQIYDTLGTLRGTAYEVAEAFLVVFRRGGPRLVMPPTVRGEGTRIHLVLIDVALLQETGSRAREHPIEVAAEDLTPERVRADEHA
jgi:hypothetical protein